jgi:beta-glucosidase
MPDSPGGEIREPIFDTLDNVSEKPNEDVSITPNTELSPPDSPTRNGAALSHQTDRRTKSATLAASLSLEEQVRHSVALSLGISEIDVEPQVSLLCAADFWRSRALPAKGIPSFKTSDGPNGARGAIFKAGTKVRSSPKYRLVDIG